MRMPGSITISGILTCLTVAVTWRGVGELTFLFLILIIDGSEGTKNIAALGENYETFKHEILTWNRPGL